MERTTVLAICGSLREHSLHRALLTAVERRSPELLFVGTELVRDLPLLDPDLDTPDRLPSVVREFRLLAEAAAGGIVSSPEYVHSASGVTKNALDWLAGSTGLYGKPVLLMSASPGQTGGIRGLAALVPTLLALDAVLVDPRLGLACVRPHPARRVCRGGRPRPPTGHRARAVLGRHVGGRPGRPALG